jgi:hypothetical protein
MSVFLRACATLFLVLTAAACSAGDTAAPPASPDDLAVVEVHVEPEQVAERLLTELRDRDYEAAFATLSTGQARDLADDSSDLESRMTSADTLVADWSLEKPSYFSTDDGFSKVEVSGSVTYDDDVTGTVRVVMQALGLQADPWRVDEFELTRA